MAEQNTGKITQIIGAVMDIKFSQGKIPEINEAIRVPLEDGGSLTVEVAQDLGISGREGAPDVAHHAGALRVQERIGLSRAHGRDGRAALAAAAEGKRFSAGITRPYSSMQMSP